MKKQWLIIGLLLAFVLGYAAPKRRFEHITYQYDNDINHVMQVFEVWHDTETGQEFICARGYKGDGGITSVAPIVSVSCWLTGRKW